VIRQAISCDICGTEKGQTNHWFVACEQGGELRISDWKSRNRSKPGAKHLCGQTCLHKLADDFMARSIAVRTQPGPVRGSEVEGPRTPVLGETSPAMDAPQDEFESSARLIGPAEAACLLAAQRTERCLLEMPEPIGKREQIPAQLDPELAGGPNGQVFAHSLESTAPHNRRAEAWKRERERELKAAKERPEVPVAAAVAGLKKRLTGTRA
jgi:hypothetical protein